MGKGVTLAAMTAAWIATTAGAAHAATAGQVVASLNAQRAAAGLPAAITENSAWSAACRKHNLYQQAHGRAIVHGEPDTEAPTYSPEGDAISRGAVLSVGRTWDAGNPFTDAPIHLHQLLAPRLSTLGADELDGLVCVSTFGPQPGVAGYARASPSEAAITTYPRDGATAILGNEIASEGPFTPGQILGLPAGTETGRYLMVFVDGPWQTPLPRIDITVATLKNATTGAPVELKIADVDVPTPDSRTLGDYLPQGAQLIPVKPLAPATIYEAHVELSAQDTALARTWRFTTASAATAQTPATPAARPPELPRLTIDPARFRDGRLRFTVRAGKQLVGRRATLTFKVRGRRAIKRALKLATTRTVRVSTRRATLTVRVAAFTAAGASYGAISVTRSGRA